MKILLTGANGQLGRAVQRQAAARGIRIAACDRALLDITDRTQVETVIAHERPDYVLNAAAYTAVDKAEQEKEAAYRINRDGPAALAQCCHAAVIPLLHVSTDYVFDGKQMTPYREQDPTRPVNVYGASKLAGEEAVRRSTGKHIILRTSWVFSEFGQNFVKTMLRLGAEQDELRVIDDQIGCPTAAADIATALLDICIQLRPDDLRWGTYHFCSTPPVSWCGFARAIFACAESLRGGLRANLVAIPSSEYKTQAVRPWFTVLDCSEITKKFGILSPDWRTALRAVVNALDQEAGS